MKDFWKKIIKPILIIIIPIILEEIKKIIEDWLAEPSRVPSLPTRTEDDLPAFLSSDELSEKL